MAVEQLFPLRPLQPFFAPSAVKIFSATPERKKSAAPLAGQFSQKLALIHAVLKRLVPIDKHHGHLVVILTPQFGVAFDIHFLPGKAASAGKFGKAFFHHLAQVASSTGINDNLS
jgi:hypothetical protein